MKIITKYDPPPIPDRRFDWCAYYEGREEDGRYGWGRTEQEAIDDFQTYLADNPAYETVLARLTGSALHPDTQQLLVGVMRALEEKLIRAQVKYGFTNNWKHDNWEAECKQKLRDHLEKGDPLDVMAYAAFCWGRGWSTSAGCDSVQPGRLTMWAEVVETYEGEGVEWRCFEESGRDGDERKVVELAADTFPKGTMIEIREPLDQE